MSDTSTGDTGKSTEKPEDDLSGVMAQLSVTADSSDNALSSSKNLSDMPFDVVGLIIERSDYKEQLILRKTSKSLRALVDNQKPACKSIQVICQTRSININFNYDYVVYTDDEDFYESRGNVVITDDFKKVAFDDLASTLKNPKLQLDKFKVIDYLSKESSEKYFNELQCSLGSLKHQVSFKEIELTVWSSSWLLSILPHLKPGVLETISLIPLRGDDWKTGMDKVVLLEQWKQAEELELQDFFDRFPMKYATHFKRFQVYGGWIDNEELNISLRNQAVYCVVVGFLHQPLFALYDLLGEPVSRNEKEEVFHHSIPDTDYYYAEIKKTMKIRRLDIEKKKRENFC